MLGQLDGCGRLLNAWRLVIGGAAVEIGCLSVLNLRVKCYLIHTI